MSNLTISQTTGYETYKYFNAVGTTILFFDYAITMEDEARWVWGRPWDVTRIVFTVSRYVPFVGMGLTLYSALRSDSMWCPHGTEANVIHAVGIIASEMLLLLRTYAFFQRNKYVLYGLLIYSVLIAGGGIVIDALSNQPIPGADENVGCFMMASRNGALAYGLILSFELLILFLMAYKQYRDYKGVTGRKSLVYTMYIDGVFYIFCISLMTVANVILSAASPMEYIYVLFIPQVALHDVLASRIIFNLRRRVHSVQLADGTMSASTMPTSTMECRVPSGVEELELEETGHLDLTLARRVFPGYVGTSNVIR